jgi:fucose permease
MIDLATSVFQQTSGKAVSLIVALGSIGGSLLPGLQGILIERTGAFSTAIMIATLAFLMLLMTLIARWIITGKKTEPASAQK